jgi:hypothetical protein
MEHEPAVKSDKSGSSFLRAPGAGPDQDTAKYISTTRGWLSGKTLVRQVRGRIFS